jgi:hypothetical protein
MKTLLAFIAGLVLGWLKRVKPCQEQGEAHTSIPTDWAYGSKVDGDGYFKGLDIIEHELVFVDWSEAQMMKMAKSLADRDENGKAIGGVIPKGWMYNLDDTPITWKSEDGWVFNYKTDSTNLGDTLTDANFINPEGFKVLGIFDRELTNDELRRIHGVGVDEIENSFEDTQPIRVRYTAEEIMPKRYPENKPSIDDEFYWANNTTLDIWHWMLWHEKENYFTEYPGEKHIKWFIDIPGAPEELKPLKYPENKPSEDGLYVCHFINSDTWGCYYYQENCGGFTHSDGLVDYFIPYRLSSLIEK